MATMCFVNVRVLILALTGAGLEIASANGLFGNGTGARSLGVAGADTAWSDSVLSAMNNNPAHLASLTNRVFELGGRAAFADGSYRNSLAGRSSLQNGFGAVPEAAFGMRISPQWAVGLSVAPQTALEAEWKFTDPPGGADGSTSYGLQTHRSRILVLRSAAGASWSPSTNFTLGASVGLLYNENELEAPYIFQSQKTLRGAKVLLDLATSGYGWDAQAGAAWRPHPQWQIGLSYKTRAVVETEGDADGNAGVQFAHLGLGAARPDFHYDAEVVNTFPQIVSLGVSWQPHPRWRWLGQVDWINWSDSFDSLTVTLRHGNNADLNGVVKSTGLEDRAPLHWEDRFVYRTGVEFMASQHWRWRAGYSYGRNPVPAGTLTPLTAVVMEHTLGGGVGWENPRFFVDLAYQWNPPNRERVGQSDLRSGEYSHSQVEAGLHWFGLTTGVRF